MALDFSTAPNEPTMVAARDATVIVGAFCETAATRTGAAGVNRGRRVRVRFIASVGLVSLYSK
jgi:hypothetical protein